VLFDSRSGLKGIPDLAAAGVDTGMGVLPEVQPAEEHHVARGKNGFVLGYRRLGRDIRTLAVPGLPVRTGQLLTFFGDGHPGHLIHRVLGQGHAVVAGSRTGAAVGRERRALRAPAAFAVGDTGLRGGRVDDGLPRRHGCRCGLGRRRNGGKAEPKEDAGHRQDSDRCDRCAPDTHRSTGGNCITVS
jgi:hypothetical protein